MRLPFWICSVFLLVPLTTSQAGFNYSFEVADASNISGTLGGTSFDFSATGGGAINLYLVQRWDEVGSSTPTVFNSLGASFNLVRSGNNIVTSHQAVGPFTIRNEDGTSAPTTFGFRNAAFPPAIDSSLIAGVHAIQVGTMSFAGPDGSLASYNFVDPIGTAVIVNGNAVDATVFPLSQSFTVAVPEPSSLALLGLVSAGVVGYRRRRA